MKQFEKTKWLIMSTFNDYRYIDLLGRKSKLIKGCKKMQYLIYFFLYYILYDIHIGNL